MGMHRARGPKMQRTGKVREFNRKDSVIYQKGAERAETGEREEGRPEEGSGMDFGRRRPEGIGFEGDRV